MRFVFVFFTRNTKRSFKSLYKKKNKNVAATLIGTGLFAEPRTRCKKNALIG